MRFHVSGISWRHGVAAAAVLAAVAVGAVFLTQRGGRTPDTPPAPSHPQPKAAVAAPSQDATSAPAVGSVVTLSPDQERAIGLEVERASPGTASELLQAPGQVTPDETKFAYITPRAAGLVRSVAAHEGQQVSAGDLLATVDSPEVAQARFDLYTRSQEMDVAKDQAAWQETIYTNTVALLERLKAGDSPDEIHRKFQDRPVGTNREQLITAYANWRLARATFDRKTALNSQKIISAETYQQAMAAHESAEAAYTSLVEQMEYSARLANTQARQALRKAETALSVARERLRVLGVRPDGTEPPVKQGKVVGVAPDGTLAPGADRVKPDAILPSADPATARTDDGRPVSTYSIWAPFDGTIIDRMMIVPGVSVDTTHRIFTLADLSTVWIEVHIHESDYGHLVRGRGAKIRFTSPAYPGQAFDAELLYTGDLIDPKSRRLKLLARAENPGRLLKPGMFVDVDIRIPSDRPAALVPASALLSEDEERLVFVQVGPGRFERRTVETGPTEGGLVEVLKGVEPGEQVVSGGAFKLKAESIREAASAASAAAPAAGAGKVVAR